MNYIILRGETGDKTAFKISTAVAYDLDYFINNFEIKSDWINKIRIAKLNDKSFGVKRLETLSPEVFYDVFSDYLNEDWMKLLLVWDENEKSWNRKNVFNKKTCGKYGSVIKKRD